ncbi:MAG TPA: ABC transporter permease [Gemmatimonadaceae bacterium]
MDLSQDLRYGLRHLVRSPAFTLAAVVTIALGIGANTAIFSVVNAVLLRPLPYPAPDRLVSIRETSDRGEMVLSPPNLEDFRAQRALFESMAGTYNTYLALTGEGDAEQLVGAAATEDFFRVLATPPLVGRGFRAEDAREGAPPVVVLREDLWRRRFGADPAIVGRAVQLDGVARTVVGVMPASVDYPDVATELWIPLGFSEEELATQRGAHYLDAIARLAPGVTVDQADAGLRAVAARLAAEHPRTNGDESATARSLRDALVGDIRPALLVMLGAVGFVLLIACANVASLLLTRAVGRGRELAIRTALGAGRGRIARQLLVESVLLAALGGILGLLLAAWGVDALGTLRPEDVPLVGDVRLDRTVLLFTLGVTLLSAVVFGLVPAVQAARRIELGSGLREGTAGAVGARGAQRTRSVLVVAEIALALVLLAGAGLLVRSFDRLLRVDPGFDPAGVLTFSVSLPDAKYDTTRARAYVAALTERLQELPGVTAVGAASILPLSGSSYGISLTSVDGRAIEDGPDAPSVQVRLVTPGYLHAMGMPLRRGRDLGPSDRPGAPHVLLANEAAARLLWPGEDAVGRSLVLGTRFGFGGDRAGGEVVGIVGDVREMRVSREALPTVYLPHAQWPVGFVGVALRADGDPEPLVAAAREHAAALDADVPVVEVLTMEQRLAGSVARQRFYMLLLAVFAVAAAALAAIGIYGVMAFGVAQRTREIGIRVALGARPGDVARLVVRAGLLLAVTGVVLGLAGALALTRLLEGLLYGVEPSDPATLAAASLLLLAVAALAALLPARRAAGVDPMQALRTE